MKQALVFSDSHGDIGDTLEIIRNNPEAEAVFHCGDIKYDADRLRNSTPRAVVIVRGNCDFTPELKDEIVTEFAGKKIAICHGHRQEMMGGLAALKYWGKEKGADIVLFGHTHVPFVGQEDGMTIINPGSISRPRQEGHRKSYALLEVDDGGGIHVEIKYT